MLKDYQKREFERNGVVLIKGVLNADEVDTLRNAVDRQIASVGQSETAYDFEQIGHSIWDDEFTPDIGNASRFDLDSLKTIIRDDPESRNLLVGAPPSSPDKMGRFIYDSAAWRIDDGVKEVALSSRLPEICAELLDARYLNFWEDTTFVKTPGTRQRTAFHQDLGYFQIEGDQCVIAWLPLDWATFMNGSVEYVRGSHLWPHTFACNSFIAQTPLPLSEGSRLPDIEGNRDDFDIISFNVQPGDAVICHVRTVHGSGGNLTNAMRRAMSFRYCGDQVRYYSKSGALKESSGPSTLSSGDRLFSDDYPMAWPPSLRGLTPKQLAAKVDQIGLLEVA